MTANIQDIINLIETNNFLNIKLPVSKEEIKVKRYDLKSISKLSSIINQKDISKIVIEYGKFLIDIVKLKTEKNLPYIDYITLLMSLRATENEIYNNINLKDIINSINIDGIKFDKKTEIVEKGITYKVEFHLPNISRIEKILEESLKEIDNSLLYYNIFKFVKRIEIITDTVTSSIETEADLKTIYDIISYRVLNEISKVTSTIEKDLYSLFKVNIETDTSFLYTI